MNATPIFYFYYISLLQNHCKPFNNPHAIFRKDFVRFKGKIKENNLRKTSKTFEIFLPKTSIKISQLPPHNPTIPPSFHILYYFFIENQSISDAPPPFQLWPNPTSTSFTPTLSHGVTERLCTTSSSSLLPSHQITSLNVCLLMILPSNRFRALNNKPDKNQTPEKEGFYLFSYIRQRSKFKQINKYLIKWNRSFTLVRYFLAFSLTPFV